MNNEEIRKAFEKFLTDERYDAWLVESGGHVFYDDITDKYTTKNGSSSTSNQYSFAYSAFKYQQKRIDELESALQKIKRIAEHPPQDRLILKTASEALKEQGK
jgi:thymidylate synthase